MRSTWIVVGILMLISPAAAEQPPGAMELISRGEVHEARNEFDAAIRLYTQLELLPGQRGPARYLQGRASYLKGDLGRAQQLAIDAVRESADPWKFKAQLLYGETLFRNGEFRRAKAIFLELRRQQQRIPARRVELEGRVVACNKVLELDARDGL